jgi:hypothetical protein
MTSEIQQLSDLTGSLKTAVSPPLTVGDASRSVNDSNGDFVGLHTILAEALDRVKSQI